MLIGVHMLVVRATCASRLRVEVLGKDRVGEQFLWPAEVCGGKGVEGGGESGRGVRKGDWWE
jgi:hypothetical protein